MKRNEIEQMLPGIFQRTVQEGTPLFALLEVMEALPAPDEAALDQLDACAAFLRRMGQRAAENS